MKPSKPRLNLYLRKPIEGAFSIEMLYQSLLPNFWESFEVTWIENQEASKGFWPRLRDAVRAAFSQADVNHVTGDVHFLTFFMRRHRTVLTIHDFYGLERLKGVKKFVYFLLWYWLAVRRAEVIVVISKATQEQLHKYLRIDPKRVNLIPNPVREEFSPSCRAFSEVCPRILQVGTGRNKNLERNIKAIAGFHCRLVVLGFLSPVQKSLLVEFEIDYECHVNLSASAVADLYRSCDLLLFTSVYEGFGMPIIEAQATGLPVITSRCWSMPEVAGDGALLVDPHDELAIASALRVLVTRQDVRESLVLAGFENVKRFRTSVVAERYMEIYKKLLNL